MSEAAPAPPPDLRLRAPSPPVLRLSRRSVALLSAAGLVAIAGAVGAAMTLSPRKAGPPPVNLAQARPPEALQTLPADYRGPRLGPPLPGDLGGPMVAAAQTPPPTSAAPEALAAPPPDPAVERRKAELDAARRSRLILETNDASVDRPPPVIASSDLTAWAGDPRPGAGHETTNPGRLQSPATPYVLMAGDLIPAALITGLRSDAPGQVIAQVTQPIFDTPTGQVLLIPQGARLIGTYENRVAFGQRRIHVAWTRLILPNGRSLRLDKAPAGDLQGYAGLQDQVDRRWGQLFGTAALSTLLAMGSEVGAEGDSDLIRALRRGAGDSFSQTGRQAVGQGLSVPPTLTIRPGTPVRLLVTQDLILEPYQEPAP